MRLPSRHRNAGADIAMTPMIDVVFLLLVFFVWTASFQAVEWMLPGRVSQQAGARPTSVTTPPPEADFDETVVRIVGQDQEVQYLMNGEPLAGVDQLQSRLKAILEVEPGAAVIIDPDPEVALGVAIDVYDAALAAGATEAAFAAPASALGGAP